MKFKYITLLIVIFITSFVFSYLLRSSENVQELLNPKTTLGFEKTVYNFGNILPGKESVTYFVFQNTGETSLKIYNITSSCGCTVPKWPRKKLEPGVIDSILVKYDANNIGYFSQSIYILSNSKTSPDVLYISGNVMEEK